MYKHNAIMCPGDHYKEHDKLETLLKRHLELSDQINDYRGILERATGTDREQATKAVEILEAQRDLLKTGIENMRELFMDKVDDLMGDTSWTILTFYPSTRYCFKKDLPVRLPS